MSNEATREKSEDRELQTTDPTNTFKREYVPSNLGPAEVKDKLLTPEEQEKEGKHADGRVSPRYLLKAIPVAPADQQKIIHEKEEAGIGEKKKSA